MSGPTRAGHRLVVKNAAEICVPEAEGAGVQRLTGHALYIEGGRVAWLGPQAELPASAHDAPEYDAADRAVLPAQWRQREPLPHHDAVGDDGQDRTVHRQIDPVAESGTRRRRPPGGR